MKLFLEATKVISLQFSCEETDNMFGYEPNIIDNRTFSIHFIFAHSHKDGISINVKYQAIFKTEDDIDDSLLDNPFLHVNAPAIAYPFLRAYIANILLMSGYDPLMLPSINFDAEWKKRNNMQSK